MKINDKVKVLRKMGNNWVEAGRGYIRGFSSGKHNQYIWYTDRDWTNDIQELININAPCIKVIKW